MIKNLINCSEETKLTTFLNPFSYLGLRKTKKDLKDFNIKIDGGLLVVLLKLFGFNSKRESFDMTSLAPVIFNKAIGDKKSIYFVGTKPKVIDIAVKNIKEKFPELNICGYNHGYIKKEDRENIFNTIIRIRPDYVICGMGTPLQEDFLIDLQARGWNGEGYTCGGFLHQTADKIQYYPYLINKLGLRAFYRMYDEPKLLFRYFIDYPKAIVVIIYDLLRYRFF